MVLNMLSLQQLGSSLGHWIMWNDAIEPDSFNSQPTHGTQKLFTLGFISHHTLSIKTLLVWSWDRNEACYQKIFHSIKLERNGGKGMFKESQSFETQSEAILLTIVSFFSPLVFFLLKEHVTFDWRDCFPWKFQIGVNAQIWMLWKLYSCTVKYYSKYFGGHLYILVKCH